jgi:hypothetical protein
LALFSLARVASKGAIGFVLQNSFSEKREERKAKGVGKNDGGGA